MWRAWKWQHQAIPNSGHLSNTCPVTLTKPFNLLVLLSIERSCWDGWRESIKYLSMNGDVNGGSVMLTEWLLCARYNFVFAKRILTLLTIPEISGLNTQEEHVAHRSSGGGGNGGDRKLPVHEVLQKLLDWGAAIFNMYLPKWPGFWKEHRMDHAASSQGVRSISVQKQTHSSQRHEEGKGWEAEFTWL